MTLWIEFLHTFTDYGANDVDLKCIKILVGTHASFGDIRVNIIKLVKLDDMIGCYAAVTMVTCHLKDREMSISTPLHPNIFNGVQL